MRRKKKNSIILPVILFVAVIALSVGGVILAQSIRRARIQNPGDYASQDEIPRMTVSEAYEAVMNGEAILVDTRSEAQYQAQRAIGAISLPIDQVEFRLGELDPEQWYITYCT
jgi:hypothetical protein